MGGCGTSAQTDPCDTYVDTDGDTIADSVEGTEDHDDDGVPNNQDLDSDGDTIPDAVEAGDGDLCTDPANTDRGFDSSGNETGDEDPDFLDEDSDNDGLADAEERELGTNPTDRDSDGDGVTDYGEVCFGTNPTDPTSSIVPDSYVILPYLAPAHEFVAISLHPGNEVVVDITASVEECPVPYCHGFGEIEISRFIGGIQPLSGSPDAPEGFSSMDETTFYGVNPGTELTFEVDFYNDCVRPDDVALVGRICFVALDDGGVEIDRQDFIIIVPAESSSECVIC